MANLKEIRSRISSVSSTMKITSAMKMVSAAKLKKAQDRMQGIKPYSSALQKSINNLLPSINPSEITLLSSSCATEKLLIIAISSNRGLCGGFNANVFKTGRQQLKSNTEVFCVGKKTREQFARTKCNIIASETDVLDNPTVELCKALSTKIMNEFKDGKWSEVVLIYNQFKNAATQLIRSEKILPITPDENIEDIDTKKRDYTFEPDKTQIINSLMPQQIHTQLFEAILNSIASEHGARMTAMHKATDNAQDIKDQLTLTYNRQRQAAITNEILEIVAGAEALKGS